MRIIAPPATCPPGCAGHLPADDGVVHLGRERRVTATAGPESVDLYVSAELVDVPGLHGVPAVRLLGADDAPMDPHQALELAEAIRNVALTALRWTEVTR